MESNKLTKTLVSSYSAINVAIISGFICGILLAAYRIHKNQYFDYEVYNPIPLDIKAYLNEFLVIFLLLALGIFILYFVLSAILAKAPLIKFQDDIDTEQ